MIKNQKLYNKELVENSNVEWISWEKLNNKTILITGASGMIGSYIVDLLLTRNDLYNAHISVYALGRNKSKLEQRFSRWETSYLKLIEMDVTNISPDAEFLKDIDYIIHAASNTHPKEYACRPVDTIKTNVQGLMNLLDSQVNKEKKAKIVLLSSVEIYGEAIEDEQCFTEVDMGYINSNTLRAGYPESKRLGETLLQAYRVEYGLSGVVVRLCRVYGPGVEDDDTKAVSQFIKNALNKQDIVLKSDGKQFYSFCYVADASLAIIKIMLDGNEGEAYNVVSPDSNRSLREIAEVVAKLAETKVVYDIPTNIEREGASKATRAILVDEKYQSIGGKGSYVLEYGLEATFQMLK